MQKRLQEIQLPDYPPGPPAVRVQASRIPIMAGAAPPPVYPGGQLSNLEKYEIWGGETNILCIFIPALHIIYQCTIQHLINI